MQDSGNRMCKPKRSDGFGRLETACFPGDPLYFLWYIQTPGQKQKGCTSDPSTDGKPFHEFFQNPYTLNKRDLLYCSASWEHEGYEYFLLLPDDALYNRVGPGVKVSNNTSLRFPALLGKDTIDGRLLLIT